MPLPIIPFLVPLLTLGVGRQADPPSTGRQSPILLFAASSTVNVAEDLAEHFESRTEIRVQISAAGSPTLARQIAAGAGADLFLSASRQWVDFLAEQGLVARRTELAVNQLVVVVPPNSTRSIHSLNGLLGAGVDRIAMGDPYAVPAGIYGREALTAMGLWDDLQHKVAGFANVRQALLFVERGEADAGIVYATDAVHRAVRVAARIEFTHARPVIELALLERATPHAHRNRLYDYLGSPAALQILTAYGFMPPTPELPQDGAAVETPDRRGHVLLSAEEWSATRLSLLVATCAVLGSLPLAIVLGYVLARRQFAGKWIVEALLNLPLVVPPVVTGYLLLVLFGRTAVIGGWMDHTLGIRITFTWLGAALAAAVVSFPLMLRAVRLSFEGVDPRLVTAARGLGAGALTAFFLVSLPLARRGVYVGAMLAFARSLGEFGATIMVASNIAGQTRTIPLAIFHTVERSGMDQAWRLVVLSIVLAGVAMVGSELLQRKHRPQ